jgi:uncharacterized repeat protein (TIGR01451 family)
VVVNSGTGAPLDGTLICATADANESVVGGNRGAGAERCVVVDGTSPILTLGMMEDQDPVEPGKDITYILTYGNRGNVDASGVNLRAPLPAGTTLVTASDGGAIIDGAVSWTLGTIGAGGSGQRWFTVALDGGIVNGSTLLGEAGLWDTANPQNSARATAVTAVGSTTPYLALSITALPDPVRPGELITYTYTVTNRGTGTAYYIYLDALVPNHTSTTSERITDGGSCGSTDCHAGDKVEWSLGSLPPGERQTVGMAVVVNSGTGAPLDGTLICATADANESVVGGNRGAGAERCVVVGF